MLTDGDVGNPEMVIELARNNADSVKIHSFGVGRDCSKHLITEVAKAGRGTASFVEDNSYDLKGKVV